MPHANCRLPAGVPTERCAGGCRSGWCFPTFKPLGPAVLMAEDLAEQPDLLLQTFVNGELRQQGRTSGMLFDLAEIIAYVSSRVELRAGDVPLTGTPSGVALADGRYLAAGDRVEGRNSPGVVRPVSGFPASPGGGVTPTNTW
jgi:2-keto-4-pentenoate hydratase/2-oxohepta-3-ene-1,7-dioic acid hydratase in catechol pathway